MRIHPKNQSNKGMGFEQIIETTNRHYEITRLAIIQKISTPAKNIGGRIVYSAKSTVDFIGMTANAEGWGGLSDIPPIPVAFEAKETTGRRQANGTYRPETSFPLFSHKKPMVSDHQLDFLQRWERTGGMAFILIHFAVRGECYRVPVGFIQEKYRAAARGGSKSIPYEEFQPEWKVDPRDYLNIL